MNSVSRAYGERAGGDHCCNRATMMWAEDELLTAAIAGRPLPTDVIDQLPPFRARLVVTVCLRAGARLQHGTPDQFDQAAVTAGHTDPGGGGWWRAALGLPPIDPPRPAAPRNQYRVPTGWQITPTPTT